MFIAACRSTRYSNLEILAGDVCFANLFRSILPVVPTECDVLIVCGQHNDKQWKFIIIIIIHLLRIKAAHNTLQYIKRSSSNKREEIKTNTTIKETNVQNKRKT